MCSCSDNDFDGMWKLNLSVQGKLVPFNLKVVDGGSKAILYNGAERIQLSGTHIKEVLTLTIQNFDHAIVLKRDQKRLVGYWTKHNKKNYKLPIHGQKGSWKLELNYPQNFPKKWKITFTDKSKKKDDALLIFDNNNASILTTTGDYRFLRPVFNKKTLSLYGFDGAFSFYFKGYYSKDHYTGKMYSGLNWVQDFSARPDREFELPDASKITSFKEKFSELCLRNLEGSKTCINNMDKKGKVIQIFGSWCPNCIDETKFIKEFKKENKTDVDFYIVSFERGLNEKSSLKSLKKTRDFYEIDYPILIGGLSKSVLVSDIFKSIDNFASFPTTIFINKKGDIVKIHSGFNGPATGLYYKKFKMEFASLIKKIQ